MGNQVKGSKRSWAGTVAFVLVVLGTHVLLAQTTDIEGWPRSVIAIGAGIAAAVLAAAVRGGRRRSDAPTQD